MEKANRFSNMANKLYSPGKDKSTPEQEDLSTKTTNNITTEPTDKKPSSNKTASKSKKSTAKSKGSTSNTSPKKKEESASKTKNLTIANSKGKKTTATTPKDIAVKTDAKASKKQTKVKRGRKSGTVLVNKEDQKKSISISVDPKDEELYKRIVQKNKKRFRNLSYLVELALDEYIKKNKLS